MAIKDTFSDEYRDLDDPAIHAFAITAHNTDDLAYVTRGLYVGVSGDVKVDMRGGESAVVFTGLAAGVIHPLRVKRVYDTDTDATNIVGVY